MAIYISRMGVKFSPRPLLDWALTAFHLNSGPEGALILHRQQI